MLTSRRSAVFAAASMFWLGASLAHAQSVVFVDDDAQLGGDGATWISAFTYLQDALHAAEYGDEIRTDEEAMMAFLTYPDVDRLRVLTLTWMRLNWWSEMDRRYSSSVAV